MHSKTPRLALLATPVRLGRALSSAVSGDTGQVTVLGISATDRRSGPDAVLAHLVMHLSRSAPPDRHPVGPFGWRAVRQFPRRKERAKTVKPFFAIFKNFLLHKKFLGVAPPRGFRAGLSCARRRYVISLLITSAVWQKIPNGVSGALKAPEGLPERGGSPRGFVANHM